MVTSINGQTGDVTLSASDLNAVDIFTHNADKSILLAQIGANSTQIANMHTLIINNSNNIGSLQNTVTQHASLIGNITTSLVAMASTVVTASDVAVMVDPS